MSKKKYTPQAGDVCEWTYEGEIMEVMIISPIETDFCTYEAISIDHLRKDYTLPYAWYCGIDQLKLIYKP